MLLNIVCNFYEICILNLLQYARDIEMKNIRIISLPHFNAKMTVRFISKQKAIVNRYVNDEFVIHFISICSSRSFIGS